MEEKTLSLPGKRLPEHAERETIGSIRAKYRPESDANYFGELRNARENRPTWAIFPRQPVRIAPEDLASLPLDPRELLLLYREFELPGCVHEASWATILEYLSNRARWDRPDLYVLPKDLSWVIAYTHEYVGEVDVVLMLGPVPRCFPDPIKQLPLPVGRMHGLPKTGHH